MAILFHGSSFPCVPLPCGRYPLLQRTTRRACVCDHLRACRKLLRRRDGAIDANTHPNRLCVGSGRAL
jgi:hypothetical protein